MTLLLAKSVNYKKQASILFSDTKCVRTATKKKKQNNIHIIQKPTTQNILKGIMVKSEC